MASQPLTVTFRPARPADSTALAALARDIGLDPDHLDALLSRGTVMGARRRRQWVSLAALDLENARLFGPVVAPGHRRQGLGRQTLVAAERRAAAFLLFELCVRADERSIGFFTHCGYSLAGEAPSRERDRSAPTRAWLRRRFSRRQSRYGRRIAELLATLGLPGDYGRQHCLPLQREPARLVDAGTDVFDRPRQLTPAAGEAWRQLRAAADRDGVVLQLVSAFRSVDYQAGIIRHKLERGQAVRDILRVSAAPGFSEHHTGRAIDLTTPGAAPLEVEFEATPAYDWLCAHAAGFGFHHSYPRDNVHRIAFEPWHWCYQPLS